MQPIVISRSRPSSSSRRMAGTDSNMDEVQKEKNTVQSAGIRVLRLPASYSEKHAKQAQVHSILQTRAQIVHDMFQTTCLWASVFTNIINWLT